MRRSSLTGLLASVALPFLPAVATAQSLPPAGPVSIITGEGAGVIGSNRPSQAEAPVGPVTGRAVQQSSAAQLSTTATTPQSPDLKLGEFTLRPSVAAGSFYDDNVYATSAFRRSDVAFFVRPEIAAAAGGDNYGIQASAFVEGRKYTTLTSEDQVNGGTSVAGVYQPDGDTQVRAQADYAHAHEDRGLGQSAFILLDHPVAFNQVDGAVALNKKFGRYWASVGSTTTGVLYENATLQGLPINQIYRNVAIPTITGRVGYVVAPLTSVFAEVTGNARDFQFQQLSSAGYRTVAGLLLEPGPGARVKGEVFGGYMHQDYQGAGLLTVDSWTYGTAVGFLLTPNLTLTVDGRREAKESPLFDGSLIQTQLAPTGGVSIIESSIGGRFDYQPIDRLTLSAGATYLEDEYQGIGQRDKYVSPTASVNYVFNKTFSAGLQYRRLEYRPDIFGLTGFKKDVVLASGQATF